ncbi:MAG: hypothetical protein DHS20C21_24270 [Gemmatimonadota bacterium]|nr:MAG: hypothetical protein DHS20C21_24270 [Gemmatimonadota bacterium]
MSRLRMGALGATLAFALVALAPGAQAQSALANCKYYTKIQQDFEQGLPYCSQCIEDEPDNPEARFYGAWCLAEMGEWDTAWTSFEWLIDRAEDKDKKIRKHSKMASQQVSVYFANHFNKGVEYLNAGEEQYPNARDEFEIATRISPRQAVGFLNLGFTENQLGNPDAALSAFESAIAVEPDNATAYEYYSVALGNKRESLLAAEPRDEAALAEVTGRLKETLVKVIANAPANDAALLQLGDLAAADGDMDTAIEHVQAAIKIDPNNVVKLYNIAVGLYERKNLAAAERTFLLVADEEDDPDSDLWRDAKYNAALAMKSQEKTQESLDIVLELLELVPGSKEYHSLASQLYLAKKELQKASEHMQKAEAIAAQTVEGSSQ